MDLLDSFQPFAGDHERSFFRVIDGTFANQLRHCPEFLAGWYARAKLPMTLDGQKAEKRVLGMTDEAERRAICGMTPDYEVITVRWLGCLRQIASTQ